MKRNLVSTGTLVLWMALRVMGAADATNAVTAAGGAAATTVAPAAPAPVAAAAPLAGAVVELATNAATPPDAGLAAPATNAPPGSPPPLASFDLIWQRNIFSPTRQPYVAGTAFINRGPVIPPKRVETFRFCGATYQVGKGFDAFFTGDGAPASAQLNVGDPINGFKITYITNDAVTLIETNSTNSAPVVLQTENGPNSLTRADGGPWTTNTTALTRPVFVAPPAPVVADATTSPDMNQATVIVDNGGGTDFTGVNPYNANPFGATRTRGPRIRGAGGGFNNAPAAPVAPADPAVLERLRLRRAQENQ